MRFRISILLLLIAATALHAQPRPVPSTRRTVTAVPPARVTVASSGDAGVTVEVAGLHASLEGSGPSAIIMHNAAAQAGIDGKKGIQLIQLTIGVPADAAGFTVTATPSAFDTLACRLPADRIGQPGADRIIVGAPVIQRGLRTVVVLYRPIHYEDGRAIIESAARITLSWKRSATGMKSGVQRRESASIEEALRGTIINYDQAKRWRQSPVASRSALAAPAWGMEKGVVISTGRDGIYAASGADLRRVGADGAVGAPIAQLRIRNRDHYLRFFVNDANGNGTLDAEDTVEFIGRRNPSDEGLYYDAVTDTNAYILSWNGGPGSQPQLVARSGPATAPALAAYDSTLHMEEENVYFPGISYPFPDIRGDVTTIHVTERVENERFYWTSINYPEQALLSFNCSPWFGANGTIHMSIRMVGITDTLHRVLVQLNGIDLGEVFIVSRTDTTVAFDLPVNYFVNGRNTMAFVPKALDGVPDRTFPDASYVDYIELKGRWLPSSFGPAPKVRMPSDAGGQRRVAVTGLTAPVTRAISSDARIAVDSLMSGFLFRLSSRQFDPSQRINPGFIAQFGSENIASPNFGGGLELVEVDGASGGLVRKNFFDLYPGNQQKLNDALAGARDFLRAVPSGNIILAGFAVGGGEQGEFPADLKAEFAALGATRVSGNNFVASWAFAVRKGSPETVNERFANLDESNRGISLDAFIPASGGTSYRAALTLDGAPGEEFQIGNPTVGEMRYHATDSLVGGSNRADMLIITHPAFRQESERLAEHRRSHGPTDSAFAVRVVDVNTIYDEFSNGVKTPLALRRFIQYADSNWAAPSPGYVLLFGDASWDPQRRLPSSATIDYVPTNGIPSTDYLYTVAIGDESMAWQQFIGRLPATSATDARAMVDKLIEYDTLIPAEWNKRYVFMAGGANPGELQQHIDENESLAEGFILSPTYNGDTAMIWRTSANLALPDDKDADWARSEINKGTVWVSFAGHGATDVADLDYGYPEQFNNGNRYFVLATFSCQTGAFAEPAAPVRNERFVTYPGRGAIGSICGTSYSYPYIDQPMRQSMFDQITQPPYARGFGSIFTHAKFDAMYRVFGIGTDWRKTVDGYKARNELLMYNLLGDPSMKLATRSTVELAFTDVNVTGNQAPEPIPGDSVAVLNARIWNYGVPRYPDNKPITVVATITDRAQEQEHDTIQVSGLARFVDLAFRLPLGKEAGEYTIRLQADPERAMPETYLVDNDTSFTFRVRGNQVLPIEPVSFGRVAGYDNVVIRLLNPSTGPGADIVVDTVPTFDSRAQISSRTTGTMKLEELTTTWTFSIPEQMRSARTFWWSARTTSGPDTASANLFPLAETFTVDAEAGPEFILGSSSQMARGQIANLVNVPDGIGPGARPIKILVTSMGQSRFDPNGPDGGLNYVPRSFVRVDVDGKDYNRPPLDGVNLLVMDGARVLSKGSFALYQTADADRFLKVVNDSIATGQRVLLWANGQSFHMTYRGDEIRAALRSLGMSAQIADSIGEEDSYALIAGKGVAPGSIKEDWVRAAPRRALGQQPPYYASVSDSILAPAGSGAFVTPTVGPATAWRSAVLDRSGGAPVNVTVYGIRRDGVRDSIMHAGNAATLDLSGVNVGLYPRLQLRADFPNDSTVRVRRIAIDFDPSPELAIVPSTARMQSDSVMQGDPASFDATVVNLSRRYAADNITAYLALALNGQRIVEDSLAIAHLAPLDSVRHNYAINTESLKGDNRFELAVNPFDAPSEPYRQNNRIDSVLRIGTDLTSPSVTIYADGNRLMQGDYVLPKPLFEIRISDNSLLKLNDSTTMQMILDNDIINTSNGGVFKSGGEGGGNVRGTFSYRPPDPLAEGRHEMRLMTVDASGNGDTTDFVEFYVERNLTLKNVVNYPNPFVDKTTFTFLVGGATTPKAGEIGIYTVAGRKIKTIRLTAAEINIGFNRVDWDGHDDDHDRLANGVYLYKLMVDDGDAKQETIEKLVIMR